METTQARLSTNLCVANKVGNSKPQLAVEVMSNGGVLYTVFLFEIYEHEVRLNSGRFVNFDSKLADNQAAMTVQSSNRMFFAGLEFESLGHLVQRQVEWCAEMTFKDPSHWNLAIDTMYVGKTGINFFFDNVTTAVTFKLLWS